MHVGQAEKARQAHEEPHRTGGDGATRPMNKKQKTCRSHDCRTRAGPCVFCSCKHGPRPLIYRVTEAHL